MDMFQFGTVAQLVYADKHPINFARLVGELHSILTPLHGTAMMIEWDYDDIAIFDLPDTRIVLGWNDSPGKGYSACLLVSVAPQPNILSIASCDGCQDMCSRLVERLHKRYPALAIQWHQTAEPLTGDLLDRLVDELPPLMLLYPFVEPEWVAKAMAHQSSGRAAVLRGTTVLSEAAKKESVGIAQTPLLAVAGPALRDVSNPELGEVTFSAKINGTARVEVKAACSNSVSATDDPPVSEAANDRPILPRPHDRELARFREALYPTEPEDIPAPLNAKLRLAVHALNATLILVWVPLGAAAMTYSILKGEDMKFSGRLMVLTGLFATAINSPIGQQMATIVGA